ncbi:MAG: PEP-CTERM sorting domain-containing protein, partial [Phycisphaerae bacterium]
YVWDLPGSYELTGDGGLVGTIGDLGVGVEVDPALALNFTVTAGAVPTTFTITTAVLGFAPINNPLAFATAAITVTDNDHDGAMTTGLQPGGKAYQARINAGVPWANLVDMVMSPPDDSATGSERRPTPSGREMIAGLVSSIQTEFKFTLTANDSASGTSRFDVIPEPATLGLLVAGGLALLRRRSR